jgi:hypothetical protein
MAFDLSNYETVDSRINRFYEKHENGRIITELIAYSDQAFIVKALVYRDAKDEHPATSGFAEEKVGASPVNRTSALENCETSAIGRALANLNFAPKGARPSVEEISKVKRYEVANGSVDKENFKETAQGAWADVGKITAKQVGYVEKILRDACSSTGIEYGDQFFGHLSEWLNAQNLITDVNELSKKHASVIINDQRSATGQKSSRLVEFLHTKQDPNFDPWKAPF